MRLYWYRGLTDGDNERRPPVYFANRWRPAGRWLNGEVGSDCPDNTLPGGDISVVSISVYGGIIESWSKKMTQKKPLFLAVASLTLAGWLSVSANAAAIVVRVAPPRPVVERIAPRPAAGYVWVGGYYRWTGAAYVWTPGRWASPPRPGAVWVSPHWEFVAGHHGYVFAGGFWR